jgi:hypothetical protein
MRYVSHHYTVPWRLIADVAVPSLQVALQVLYKQVGTLLPNVCALRTLRLRAKRTAKTAAETEEGPSRLAVWTRSRSLGTALRCIVFPSGSRWELEQGDWVRVN